MLIRQMVVLTLTGLISFAAVAEKETTDTKPGLFDGMAADVKRELDEKHAARQLRGNQSDTGEKAEPGMFDDMAADVKRTLDERHAARQLNGSQSEPSEDAAPGMFDDMAADVKRTLDD